MERLTTEITKGIYLCEHSGKCTAMSCDDCTVAKQIDRLAAYELVLKTSDTTCKSPEELQADLAELERYRQLKELFLIPENCKYRRYLKDCDGDTIKVCTYRKEKANEND